MIAKFPYYPQAPFVFEILLSAVPTSTIVQVSKYFSKFFYESNIFFKRIFETPHTVTIHSFLEIIRIEIKCVLIGLISFAFPYVVSRWLDVNIISGFSVVLMISLISTVAFVWFLGLDRATREHLLKWLTDKFMI